MISWSLSRIIFSPCRKINAFLFHLTLMQRLKVVVYFSVAGGPNAVSNSFLLLFLSCKILPIGSRCPYIIWHNSTTYYYRLWLITSCKYCKSLCVKACHSRVSHRNLTIALTQSVFKGCVSDRKSYLVENSIHNWKIGFIRRTNCAECSRRKSAWRSSTSPSM